MSSSTSVTVINAIRAVAFILKDHASSEIAEITAQQITATFTDNITTKLVDHVVAAISPQVALIHSASQDLSSSVENASALHKSLERERNEKEENLKTAAE
jgi:hypothetical protein